MNINLAAVGVVSLFVIVIGALMYSIVVEDQECNEAVTLTNGQTIECRSAHSSETGMTHITTCKDEKISIPTVRIEKITRIKTPE